jgi:hypothetical protein
MQSIYKIVGGGGGRCSCGHNQRIGRCYYLVDTGGRLYTMCEICGKQQGLNEWWGTKKTITVEEMNAHWFGGEPVKEVVCRQLKQYTRGLGNSLKREEMLRVAVEV